MNSTPRCRHCAVPIQPGANYCSEQCWYWYHIGEPELKGGKPREKVKGKYAHLLPGDQIDHHHALAKG